MNARDAWLHLRNSLANPPGREDSGDARPDSLYVACVLQFEQLVEAAAAIAPHARPLPLYYAVVHGAKALAAAFAGQPRPRGHGLRQKSGAVPADIMAFEIEPAGDETVLSELCCLTASGRPNAPVRLSDLFLSLPDLSEKPHRLEGNRALYVERVPDPTEYSTLPDPFLHIYVETASLPPVEKRSAVYPTLDGWEEGDSSTLRFP